MIAYRQSFALSYDMITDEECSVWVDSRLKQVGDVCAVIIVAPLLIALLIILMILIACIDRTWPLFWQMRIGRSGKPFRFYKLNTMGRYRAVDIGRGAYDTRATRLGKILRLTILDEVPQILINVLMGNMVLVGPRPLLQADIDLMRQRLGADDYMRWYKAYIAGRPGWTGKFGLSSRRFKMHSMEYLTARMYHDINYRRTATWWMDIKTVLTHAVLPFVDVKNKK